MAVVLATAPGERVMRPQFGCRIWDLLFEPVTANLLGLIARPCATRSPSGSRGSWSRTSTPSRTPTTPALITIRVTYRVRATNDRRNLVYPFYVIPHEEGVMALPARTSTTAPSRTSSTRRSG